MKGVPERYVPAACAAATFSVAPTVRVCVPRPARSPVVVGLLVNAVTVIVLPPEVTVKGAPVIAIVYVEPVKPVTVKDAAVTVPITAGRVTPPVVERVPAGVSITVPPTALTATLPKFMLAALAIAIGVTIVAVAVAVAETCANVLTANESRRIARTNNLIVFFIIV